MEYEHKTLEELNLLNRFLFAEAIEIPEVAQAMLEIILGKEVDFSIRFRWQGAVSLYISYDM